MLRKNLGSLPETAWERPGGKERILFRFGITGGDVVLNQKAYGCQDQVSLEENLKKAVTELLFLEILSSREHYIGEVIQTIGEKSGGVLSIVFPYAAVYRMTEAGYIKELPRRIAPDGRRRQYYAITPEGRECLARMRDVYATIADSILKILTEGVDPDEP